MCYHLLDVYWLFNDNLFSIYADADVLWDRLDVFLHYHLMYVYWSFTDNLLPIYLLLFKLTLIYCDLEIGSSRNQ